MYTPRSPSLSAAVPSAEVASASPVYSPVSRTVSPSWTTVPCSGAVNRGAFTSPSSIFSRSESCTRCTCPAEAAAPSEPAARPPPPPPPPRRQHKLPSHGRHRRQWHRRPADWPLTAKRPAQQYPPSAGKITHHV